MKKLLALCILVVSCAHVPTKPVDVNFCDKVQELFADKLADFTKNMINEDAIKKIVISNEKVMCKGSKAYAGWTTVMEGSEGKCIMVNTVISFTDTPTEIIEHFEYMSEGEFVECLTSS